MDMLGPPALPLPLSSESEGLGEVDEKEENEEEVKMGSGGIERGEEEQLQKDRVQLLYSPKPLVEASKRNSPSETTTTTVDQLATALKATQLVVSSSEESSTETETETETEDDEDEVWSSGEEEDAEDGDEEEGGEEEDDVEEEQQYEVDVGPLKDKIERGGGGTVEMRKAKSEEWGSKLVGSDGAVAATVPLEPFNHQVGGHSHIFRFSKKAVCKVRLFERVGFSGLVRFSDLLNIH